MTFTTMPDDILSSLIMSLKKDRETIERAIALMEELLPAGDVEIFHPAEVKGRRGRRSMGAEERKQVSERMKRYWRKQRSR
ncbi:MAG TPA: hypothetical protein VE959_36550 [Bryobacteraceae bacterium]|nr:hypothetical protein [Bryobacteraceae bacterium]